MEYVDQIFNPHPHIPHMRIIRIIRIFRIRMANPDPNPHLGGGCSAMDISSGTFTAQTGGLYTVTFSGQADLYSSSGLVLYILHNGSQLKESHSYSYCGSGCAHVEGMLSRTLVSIYLSQLACKKCLTHKFTDTDFRY